MKKTFSSIAFFLPLLCLGFTLLFGASYALLFQSNLGDSHQQHINTLGEMLAKQLAANSAQPIIHRDKLRTQIAVKEMSTLKGVSYVAVFNNNKQLIAQSSANKKNPLTFSENIVIEGKTAGKAVISLDEAVFFAPYQQFLLQATIAWTILTILSMAIAIAFSKKWSNAIKAIIQKLPPSDSQNSLGEIDQLNEALTPILKLASPKSPDVSNDEETFQSTVVISLKNLPRLQTQLSEDNLNDILKSLDKVIDFVLNLYKGKRLNTFNQTICLNFESTDQEADYGLRALYASFSTLQLVERLQADKGVKIDLAFAITSSSHQPNFSELQKTLLLDKQLQANNELLSMAAINEVLLDNATARHHALDNTALLEPLSSDEKMFRCDGLEETADTLVKRQLAFFEPSLKSET